MVPWQPRRINTGRNFMAASSEVYSAFLKWGTEDFRRSQSAEEAHFDAASRPEFPCASFLTRTLAILMGSSRGLRSVSVAL
jgi:hypothetical protein